MMEERFIRYCVDLILLPHDAIVRQQGVDLILLPHDAIVRQQGVWQVRKQIISYNEYKLQFNNLSPAYYK